MATPTVFIVTYRLRSSLSGVDAFTSREAAEASIVAFATDYCAYDGDDLEAALDAIRAHDHEFALDDCEVLA